MKCDCARAETGFRLPAKRTSPFKSAGESVRSTTCCRGVRISSSNAGYTVFRGSVKSIGYPLHSPVSPSLPLPYVTVCHHISSGLYLVAYLQRHHASMGISFLRNISLNLPVNRMSHPKGTNIQITIFFMKFISFLSLLSSHLLSKNIKIKIYRSVILPCFV